MNVYDRLRQDHDELRDLFAKIDEPDELRAFGPAQLYEDIKMKLIAHDKAEEATFYDAIADSPELHELVEDGKKDHKEIDRLLGVIRTISVQEPTWLDRMRDIRHKFLKHAEEEEQEMFPRARSLLAEDRAEYIGRAFQERELRLLMAERRQSP